MFKNLSFPEWETRIHKMADSQGPVEAAEERRENISGTHRYWSDNGKWKVKDGKTNWDAIRRMAYSLLCQSKPFQRRWLEDGKAANYGRERHIWRWAASRHFKFEQEQSVLIHWINITAISNRINSQFKAWYAINFQQKSDKNFLLISFENVVDNKQTKQNAIK